MLAEPISPATTNLTVILEVSFASKERFTSAGSRSSVNGGLKRKAFSSRHHGFVRASAWSSQPRRNRSAETLER